MPPRRQPLTEHLTEPLGQRLARLRKERGISQADLADRLHITQPIVLDYERGRVRLHGDIIIALTKILKISADELLGLKPPPLQASIKDRRLLERLILIDRLPKKKREALLLTMKAFLGDSTPSSESH